MERWQMKTCSACDGTGERDEPDPDLYYGITNDEDLCDTCESCNGEGSHKCETCEGTGGEPHGPDCPDCDGWGKIDCPDCDGRGYHRQCCPYCGEEMETNYYEAGAYLVEGEIVCESCARNQGAFKCETCDGKGELPCEEVHAQVGNVKRAFPTVNQSCSCCGAKPGRADDMVKAIGRLGYERRGFDVHVVRANLCDSDGVYYVNLCSIEGEGCLHEIAADREDPNPNDLTRQDKADLLAELLGDDIDGVWAAMDDDLPGFSNF